MSRTGCAAQRPRMRGAARRLPGPVPLLPARMRKGRAANTVRPARQQGPPRRRPEPDGVPGRRCPGTQPAPGGRVQWPQDPPPWPSGGPAARHVLPARPPAMQAAAGEFRGFPGRPSGRPGNGPSAGPLSWGGRIRGPAAPGGEASSPGPQAPLPRRYAAGDLRAPGPCCPNPGQTVNNPPCQPARAVLPQLARKSRRHHRPALPPPDAHLIGDLPHHPQAMTGRSGHQPSPPPGMSCPSRPAVPAWPFRLAGPASWTCTRNIPSRPASETARPQRLAERAGGVIRRTAAAMDRGGTAERPGVLPGMLPHRPARHG
jgi:hypothetical protein